MKTIVFPSMPKGEIVGNMEIQVGIDGIGTDVITPSTRLQCRRV
jgi:hypothetical protein